MAGKAEGRGEAARPGAVIPGDRLQAVIFDMDGVVTDTASVHAAAWKRLFDGYLEERSRRTGEPFVPFDADRDYRRFVDGKARYDGVRSFLGSRGISLPEGDPRDPPDRETVCGLGNRKNRLFLAHLREHGARAYPATVALVRELRARGVGTAVISASRNMEQVLRAAGVLELFDARVSGADADRLGLPGKPEPAVFLEAARRLGVDPSRAAVVEDSLAGVEAGRRGGFALVVGVDRTGHPEALREAGADVVVGDLSELELAPPGGSPDPAGAGPVRDLPLVLERREEVARLLEGRRPAVFLDYDGTLTPIVDRPEDALLPAGTRRALERLAGHCPVAVVSGRDLADVRALVGVDGIWYAGSHGFDLLGPDGSRHQRGREFLSDLEAAGTELGARLGQVPGVQVERKAFAVAVHVRRAEPARVPEVEAVVEEVARRHPRLRRTGGKGVLELRPGLPWDKGRALRFLLGVLGPSRPGVLPVYVGDDETDEDAFRAVAGEGLAVVVRGEGDDRPTAARYALRGPEEVPSFLELLADLARAG